MWSLCKQANQHSDPSRTFLSETSKKQFQALKRPVTHIPRLLSFLCLVQENPGLLPACWMLLYRPEGRPGSRGGQCFGQNKGCHHDGFLYTTLSLQKGTPPVTLQAYHCHHWSLGYLDSPSLTTDSLLLAGIIQPWVCSRH